MRTEPTSRKPSNSIGKLAVELRFCSQADVDEALAVQQKRPTLGQALVDLQKITEDQRASLETEQRIRNGAKLSSTEIQQHERRKFRQGISGVSKGFRDAGADAKRTATAVLASIG